MDFKELEITEGKNGVFFKVRVKPNSRKNEIKGILSGILQLQIKAPPQKDKANKELIKFLAKILALAKKDIKISSGKTSRLKSIHVSAISPEELYTRLQRAS